MLSYHASSVWQLMQRDAGFTTDSRRGTRAATTFRKLPTAIPGGSASADAVVASTRSGGGRVRAEREGLRLLGQHPARARVPERCPVCLQQAHDDRHDLRAVVRDAARLDLP